MTERGGRAFLGWLHRRLDGRCGRAAEKLAWNGLARAFHLARFLAGDGRLPCPGPGAEGDGQASLNAELGGYPRNHNYRIGGRALLPGFSLYHRWRMLSALCPEPLESLLDIGSSKGFFVLAAALEPGCRAAAGIDLHAPFIDVSERVAEAMGVERAKFFLAALDAVAANPARYGGPFQTVLLINTYHYLYWGSTYAEKSFGRHDEILGHLAALCTGRVIFSSPLEVDACPGDVRRRAREAGTGHDYTQRAFYEAAGRFFGVAPAGVLGRRPVLVLNRR